MPRSPSDWLRPASRQLPARTSLGTSRGDVLVAIMIYSKSTGPSVRPWIRPLPRKYFRDVRLRRSPQYSFFFQPSHSITVSKRRCCGYLFIFGENKAVNQAYADRKRVSGTWQFEGEEGKIHKLEIKTLSKRQKKNHNSCLKSSGDTLMWPCRRLKAERNFHPLRSAIHHRLFCSWKRKTGGDGDGRAKKE